MTNRILSGLESLLPQQCPVCLKNHTSSGLCAECLKQLPHNRHACRVCAEPQTQAGLICGQCQQKPPRFDQVIAPFLYEHPVDQLIKQLKFQGKRLSGQILIQSFLQAGILPDPLPDCLLPVPIHDNRHIERGFNQALWIADRFSRHLQIPCDLCLIKSRSTKDQVGLNQSERKANLKQAFSLRHTNLPKRVAIIDDVLSTGSTANEISQLLRRHGVEFIQVWVLARAAKP